MFISVNDTKLFYTKTGQGYLIILLHSNFASQSIFDVLINQLEKEYCVYAVDSRGHGKSQKSDEYDYFMLMEDIHMFILELKIEKPYLYGFSDGEIIGLLLASIYPNILSKLIVSGANLDKSGQTKKALYIIGFGHFITRDKRLKMILDQPDIPFEILHQIQIPTLILAGSNDLIREEHTRKIHEHIKGSELIILQNEGHGTYISHSPKLYPVIKPFLDKN
jgi:pimeloyl-ACP methyl ester carboxylesterase